MTRGCLVVLWCGITAIVAALAFPPYGYDRLKISIFPAARLVEFGVTSSESVETVPWKYVGHSFILSYAPMDKDRLKAENSKKKSKNDDLVICEPYVKIGWYILGGELAAIILITAGAFFTVRALAKGKMA